MDREGRGKMNKEGRDEKVNGRWWKREKEKDEKEEIKRSRNK